MTAFFSGGEAPDGLYNACRDHETKREVRNRIEEMWRRYERHCPDTHFLSDARCNFVARTWEMYIACTMLDAGFKLDRPPAKGPDIATSVDGRRLWIEAVAPACGAGADAVPGRTDRGSKQGNIWLGHPPSESSLILRCTSGLVTKRTKLAEYAAAGIVARNDAVVIAVTLGGVEDSDISSPDLPIIVKALFGVGEFYAAVSIDGSGTIEKGFMHRPNVTKKSGAVVGASFFLEKESASVSGVLFTDIGIWNAPEVFGQDLIFVHNPSAAVPLPVGLFPFADEHYVDAEGKLATKKHAVAGSS